MKPSHPHSLGRCVRAWLRAGCLAALAASLLVPARAQVIISEFMAANHGSSVDEDGDASDWIEIFNAGTNVNLAGWHLTDNAGDLTKWTFPATNLGANCFLLVWASGKDRTTVGLPLHTSFNLSSGGEYLGLVRPDGTVASEFAPVFPDQHDDVSYGVVQTVTTIALVSNTSLARVLVPLNGTLGTNWVLPGFDDSAWLVGTNGVGFQNATPGFLVRKFNAAAGVGNIGNLATAESVISTPANQSASYTEQRATINYLATGGAGHYGSDVAFPGQTMGAVVNNIVVEATGTITIPTAGNWTFGVNSDDGFRLTIGSFTALFDGGRGASDTLGVFNFPAAGDYPLRLVFFQGTGDSALELFAGAGSLGAWNPSMQLVGNTAGGGLAVRSLPSGTTGFSAEIRTDVRAIMTNQNATAYLRMPFTVANPASLQTLTLLVKYNDGFVAHVNGTEVARRNAPVSPVWNSTAAAARPSALATVDEQIDLSSALGLLATGTNVLALQGLNNAANSDEFLISAQIKEFRSTVLTNQFFATPTPATFNTSQPYYFKVTDTKFSHDRGFYDTNFTLTITCATTSAVIRCTTDGTVPTLATGFLYTNAIPITNTTTLRARAFLTGYTPSDPDTQTYIFIRDVLRQREGVAPAAGWPAAGVGPNNQAIDYGLDMALVTNSAWTAEMSNDLRSIPTFSVVMDANDLFNATTGIYVNPGGDGMAWERACSLELINPDGTDGFQVNCGTRMRGGYSRSTDNPKHAFRFFFRTDYGPGQLNYPICGTTNGATQSFQKFDLRTFQNYSWSFGGDGKFTALRDQSNRDMQLALGDPSSHGKYYYLFINGQFWGLYNIDERPEGNFGESYFGGNADQYDVIKTSGDMGYSIYATDGSIDAWTRLWQQCTNGFPNMASYQKVQGNNPDGTRNPAYENLLDVDNLIGYMLVHLWGNDIDAPISNFIGNESPNNIFCLRSTNNTHGFRFVTHDAEHTMLLYNVNIDRFGPFPAGDPFALNADGTTNGFPKSSPGYFWKQMTANAEFRMRLADRVQQACFNGGPMTVQATMARFVARSNEIARAIVLESARWGNAKRTPSYTRNDWLAAMSDCASYIQQRTDLLMAQFRAKGLFPTVLAPALAQYSGGVPPGYSLAITNPNAAGQVYYTLDGSDPRLLGGTLSPAALAYNTNLTLNTHTFLRARVKNGADWSPIIEANLYVTQDFSKLIVSEIMYNPVGGDGYEFLEFKNVGDRTLDLSGLYFSSGITFTFTNGTLLAPGGFLVLARNAANFAARYPGVTARGLYTGKLSNSGDTLALTHPLGGGVLSFTYNDSAPWPAAADGFGFSIVPVNASASFDHDNALNWRASAALYGSPGADDPAPGLAPIVINEVLTSTTAPQVDAVELFNPAATNVDVGGWFITDDKNVPMKFRIPMPTVIPPGGYVVFDESQFNVVPGVDPSFSFSSHGEQVYLFSGVSGPVPTLTGYSHGFSFGGAADGVSFGRYLNSVGDEQFPAQSALTLGTNNAGPLIGPVVLNEIQYHPLTGEAQYVELKNITASPVLFYDPAVPTNTWKINGLDFSFPTSAQIAANGFVVVAGIDPVIFRSRYGVPPSVPIFGPFPGTLQFSGERLELQRPGTPDTNGVPFIAVDAVRYNDKAPWPVSADGDGPSLQRRTATAYADDPTNWFASGTTPGSDNIYNAPPSVALTSPTNGASFSMPVNVVLQATASDTDGTVAKVEFFADNVKIGEATSSPFSFAWNSVPSGSHILYARAIDNGFATTLSSNVQISVVPPPIGTGLGLRGEYYDTMDFTGAALIRTNGTINFDWGLGAPDPTMGVDTFSVRWTGMVQPRFSETYTFYTTTDDGVRLWVNDQLIIDKWVNQSPTEWSGSIALLAGQSYKIRMDFFENGGGAVARLAWAAPGVDKEYIPQTQLYPFIMPSILTQPLSRTVGVGATITFTVVATNSPTGYQWQFNDTPIPGATTPSFTLTGVQLTNAGNYNVVVSNPVGSVISLPASLTVIPPPIITAQPQSVAVVAGANVTFSVGASGTPPLVYQWRSNGTNLVGATNSFLVLSNVQTSHIGLYSVLVTNLGGAVLSSNADLTLDGPPVIVVPPVSHYAGLTSNTTFTVLAANRPTGYEWWFNNAPLPDATAPTLLISNVQSNHAGTYFVIVTNDFGSVTSAPATLTVGTGPAITLQPQSLIATGYTTATLTVAASGTPPLQYQWRLNGTNLPGSTNTTLTLSNLQLSHSGSYQALVTSLYGSALSDAAILTVVLPLTLTSQPLTQSVFPYTNVTFAVGLSGSQPITYQWRFNGTNLAAGTNASLILSNILPASAGSYSVRITNTVSAVTSAPALLTVFTNPIITVQPIGRSAAVGSNATFNVVAVSSSLLRYQWYFNTNTALLNATNDSYSILSVQTNHYGYYNVRIFDDFGSTWSDSAQMADKLKPAIFQQPTPASGAGFPGSNYYISVSAYGPQPLTYNLRKNGNVILSQTLNDTNCTFTLTNLVFTNCGSYEVIVTNVAGNAPNSSRAYLTVMDPLTNRFAWPGSNVTFSFQAASLMPNSTISSNNFLKYQWWFNETNIVSTVTNLKTTATNIVLNLTNVQAAQEGSYTVVLTNANGLVTNQTATLTLWRKPVITQQPTNQNVPAGSDAAFSVSADGTAPLRYQWWHNQTNLLPGATAPTLTLSSVQPSQAGAYQVIITNTVGAVTSDVATLTVTLNEPPRFDPTTGIISSGGPVQFSFLGQAGMSYSVLWTNQLGGNPEDWPVLTNIPVLNATQPVPIQDDTAGQGQRFYRLRTPMK